MEVQLLVLVARKAQSPAPPMSMHTSPNGEKPPSLTQSKSTVHVLAVQKLLAAMQIMSSRHVVQRWVAGWHRSRWIPESLAQSSSTAQGSEQTRGDDPAPSESEDVSVMLELSAAASGASEAVVASTSDADSMLITSADVSSGPSALVSATPPAPPLPPSCPAPPRT